jgi:hypothetical protein
MRAGAPGAQAGKVLLQGFERAAHAALELSKVELFGGHGCNSLRFLD